MQRFTYIPANADEEAIIFTSYAPHVFWKVDGIGGEDIELVTTQSINQHGYTVQYITMEDREITLYVHIDGKSSYYEMFKKRLDMLRRLAAGAGIGTLIYENDYREYYIDAYCTKVEYDEKYKLPAIQTFKVTFTAPSPYFRDKEATTSKLSYIKGGLYFPIIAPTTFAISGYYKTINNDGHMACPVEIWIQGGAENPVLTNMTTGEFIKVALPMQTYEKLYINTDPENAGVYIVQRDPVTNEYIKEKNFEYLTLESSLWKLRPGKNIINFTSDDEDNKKVVVKIQYRKGYNGT